jgi:hypothetical protein
MASPSRRRKGGKKHPHKYKARDQGNGEVPPRTILMSNRSSLRYVAKELGVKYKGGDV